MALTPDSSSYAFRARASTRSSRAASGESALRATWTSAVPNGFSQFSGALSPTSPSSAARAAMPCWNGSGKLSSESCGTPSALRPWNVSAALTHAWWLGSAGLVASVEGRNQPPQQLATGAPVVDAEQDIDPDVRRGPGMQGSALDIVQFKRDTRFYCGMDPFVSIANGMASTGPRGPPPTVAPSGSVRRFLEQRLQRRVLERLRGLGVVEHLLKRLLHSQRLVDCLHRRVVGIREDVRLCLRLSQTILDFLPGHGAVPALREFLKMTLDPVEADLALGSPP